MLGTSLLVSFDSLTSQLADFAPHQFACYDQILKRPLPFFITLVEAARVSKL